MDRDISQKLTSPMPALIAGGGADVTIAVLDGPVDLTHPALAGARLRPLMGGGPSGDGAAGGAAALHGTAVASILFGHPQGVSPGLAWNCAGLSRPIFTDGPAGLATATQADLAAAIHQVAAAGADIINISGGEFRADGACAPVLADALAAAESAGVLVVAATGNDGCACAHVPAAVPTVLAVGATDADGLPLARSNWGPAYAGHGLVAQGGGVVTAALAGGAGPRSGTSMAAAVVSGAAALLLSAARAAGLAPRAADLRAALLAGARSSPDADPRLLTGHVDLARAWAHLSRMAGSPPSSLSPATLATVEVTMSEVTMSQEPQIESAIPLVADPVPVMAPPSPPPATPSNGIAPSALTPAGEAPVCKTCAGGGAGALVYALGGIGYDFGTESHRLSLAQDLGAAALHDPAALLSALQEDPAKAESLIWTLTVDDTPVYALRPAGAFAADGYKRLIEFLGHQVGEGAERTSVPGRIAGSTTLYNGMTVPVIAPEMRGMYSWTTKALVSQLLGATDDDDQAEEKRAQVSNLLERIYYEIRNLGAAPQERAINFAATQAYQFESIFANVLRNGMQLSDISVERSPILRPGSDSWDVKLGFFNPVKRMEQARQIFRFTIDVSDIIPVVVGKLRQWHAY